MKNLSPRDRKLLLIKIEEDDAETWEHRGMPILYFLLCDHFKYKNRAPFGVLGFPGIKEERRFFCEEIILEKYKSGLPLWNNRTAKGAAQQLKIVCADDRQLFLKMWAKLGNIFFSENRSPKKGRPIETLSKRYKLYHKLLEKKYPGIGNSESARRIVDYLEHLGLGKLTPTANAVRSCLKNKI